MAWACNARAGDLTRDVIVSWIRAAYAAEGAAPREPDAAKLARVLDDLSFRVDDDTRGVNLGAAEEILRRLQALGAAEPREPEPEYCDRCDGCGWYEGGKTLKTTCEVCGGTGVKPGAAARCAPEGEKP
jgi:hypothetical protein